MHYVNTRPAVSMSEPEPFLSSPRNWLKMCPHRLPQAPTCLGTSVGLTGAVPSMRSHLGVKTHARFA